MEQEKNRRFAGMVCLALAILLFLYVFYAPTGDLIAINNEKPSPFNEGWTMAVDGGEPVEVLLPLSQKRAPDSIILYKNRIPTGKGENLTMLFRSSQNRVRVYVEDQLIHSFGYSADGTPYENPAGSVWQLFRLPEKMQGKPITIQMTSPYRNYSGGMSAILMGSKASLVFHIIHEGFPTLINALIIMLVGIACLLVSCIRSSPELMRQTRFLGFFSIASAVWILSEARVWQLLIGNITLMNYSSFMVFMVLPMLLTAMMMSFEIYHEDKVVPVLFYFSVADYLFCATVQILGWADFVKTVIVTHLFIGVVMVYLLAKPMVLLVKKQLSSEGHVMLAAFGAMSLFATIDLVRFYVSPIAQTGQFFRMGLTVFSTIMSVYCIGKVATSHSRGIEDETLSRLAYTDLLTGLPNRNAYERRIGDYRVNESPGVLICNLDINNLKDINDIFGHALGDLAITCVGTTIASAFEGYGDCYRIGGDEFCVICERMGMEFGEIVFERIDHRLKDHAGEFPGIGLRVAHGCHEYAKGRKSSIDKAVIEADRAMYHHKQQLKKGNESNIS